MGHRGVPKLHQENTLAGFRRAVELGIPAIEMDVRLTADKHAVLCHDDSLERLAGAPTLQVSKLTLDELSKVRIRREVPMGIDAHGDRVVVRYEREEPIPTLDEVLDEVGGKIAMNIELKSDLGRWYSVDVARIAGESIAAHDIARDVIVTSFDPRKLRAVRAENEGLAVGFCFDDSMLALFSPLLDRLMDRPSETGPDDRPGHHARRLLARIVDSHVIGGLIGTHVIGAEHTLVGAETVRRMHARGVAIGTHTLFPIGSTTGKRIAVTSSQPAEVDRLVALGVDWIESDDPVHLMSLIR